MEKGKAILLSLYWRVSDGINEKRFEEVFGFSLFPD